MGCFWVILVILVFLGLVLGIRGFQRRKQAAVGHPVAAAMPDAMSPFARDLIGCYLLLLAIFLAYTIYRVLAVEYPPNAPAAVATQTAAPSGATANATPAPKTSPTPAAGAGQTTPTPTPSPTPAVPILAKVTPNTINPDGTPMSITVTGSNLSNQSRVRINGELRPTELTDKGELLASLSTNLPPGTIYVDVLNGDAFSNSLPLQIVAYGKLFWCGWVFPISPDARLLLLVIMAGALGSFIHGFQSMVDFAGNSQLKSSWTWWYIARPFIGTAIALIFYAALRGGMLAGAPSTVTDINPYGVFTIAALAGMFTDKATQKLAEVFDVLIKVDDKRKDPLKRDGFSIKMDKFPGNKLASGTMNNAYPAVKLEAAGGTPPYTWKATGLPTGMTFDTATGTIGGTPTAQGTSQVQITVTDKNNQSATTTLSLTIGAGALSIKTDKFPGNKLADGTINTAYPAVKMEAIGGVPPYTWAAAGLPAGMTVDPATGAISGTPTARGGPTQVQITVTDSNKQTATVALSITIN